MSTKTKKYFLVPSSVFQEYGDGEGTVVISVLVYLKTLLCLWKLDLDKAKKL